MTTTRPGFTTRQIHHGGHQGHAAGPLSTPICQTSTFAMESARHGAELFDRSAEGYIYTRLGNPDHALLEQRIADLENGEAAVATSSGMAAISSILLTLLKAGDHVVSGRVLYGCTFSLLRDSLPRLGIDTTFADTTNLEAVREALQPATRLVFLETPTNPNLEITDIAAVCRLAHDNGILVAVDNTFCTPYLQRPLDCGADIVVHSATKYLNGHGDVVAGMVVGGRSFVNQVRDTALRQVTGAVLGPFEAFLILRGLKTLSYRMQAHCRNAQVVADFLQSHPMVEEVVFPGLPSHPQFELAQQQMVAAGGMVSCRVKGGYEAAARVIDSLEMISIAVSLGDVETLVEHPASMTHASYSLEERRKAGITENLIRFSIGLEDPEDIIRDIDRALTAAAKKRIIAAPVAFHGAA